jgi:hypothetical protein
MSDPRQDYDRALTNYRKALARLKEAKAALALAKAKPPPRAYSLSEIDAFFPPPSFVTSSPHE